MQEKILIVDFGSQYTQLIARRVREMNVYCEIVPCNKLPQLDSTIKGIILSGSPYSVDGDELPPFDLDSIIGEKPLLGVCYGAQLMAGHFGGHVSPSARREYGRAQLSFIDEGSKLMAGIPTASQVWMSHGDTITELPESFKLEASTSDVPVAAFSSKTKVQLYGIQFHPEVTHSEDGHMLLQNFVKQICGCAGTWTPESFVQDTVQKLRELIGADEVILGLSGGVDSSVAALLLHRAIGSQLHCIFVNNGLLRKNEFNEVLNDYADLGLNIRGIDASSAFIDGLKGTSDPEQKRKIIGRIFIEVFQSEAKTLKNAKWLAQGTIYPDVIESVSVHGPSATIKSHHNVGGLPEKLHLKVVEPLRELFKDEVRYVGRSIGLPPHILNRHPFPGPGLGIRILGEVTEEKIKMLQEADHIFIQRLKEENWYDKVWQAGVMLLPVQSVGVMGDFRTYEFVCALRSVSSNDGMTADWSPLPHDLLAAVSTDIINQVKGINRVVYDISTKPPSTIEWE